MEPSTIARPPFAHASEAEFARILDFYEVRWEYEPHVFPILWNLDGVVVESFAPDFWLPDLELYVEMTTLKQSLVRKKNRKLRRLRELYPAVRIKLFYGRDFRALMLKYGKHGLIGAMSGTPGQATPPRPVVIADLAVGVDASAAIAAVIVATALPVESPAPTPAAAIAAPDVPLANRRNRRRRSGATAAAKAAAAAPLTTHD
jgi:hypothetical protein